MVDEMMRCDVVEARCEVITLEREVARLNEEIRTVRASLRDLLGADEYGVVAAEIDADPDAHLGATQPLCQQLARCLCDKRAAKDRILALILASLAEWCRQGRR